MKFTIFGANGFIGSHLVNYLKQNNIPYFSPSRDDPTIFQQQLGHVIYCIGLTGNFRHRVVDTVQAHVCKLLDILTNTQFDSWLYLSSTRVYLNSENTQENAMLKVDPSQVDYLYNISKMMGESVCLANPPKVRIARLASVYGPNNAPHHFLNAVLRAGLVKKKLS